MLKYLNGIENNKPYYETENLTLQDRYNDYIITGLRTIWGISESYIQKEFPSDYLAHFQKIKEKNQRSGHVEIFDDQVRLSAAGLFISDKIMSDFMIVESC